MNIDDTMKTAHNGIALVGEIMKAAGDNQIVKEAGQNLGQTALTITETINTCLLPLTLMNFAGKKSKEYFCGKFKQEIAAKIDTIHPEQIVAPKASIAGPALQGLAFTHEEPNLKELYLSLLATAMDNRVASDAHPAFVEVIRQLNSDDAYYLRFILSSIGFAIIKINLASEDNNSHATIARHVLPLNATATYTDNLLPPVVTPVENPQLPALVDNWIRLGLVEVNYTVKATIADAYEWVDKRPEVIALRQTHETEKRKISFQYGTMTRTDFGAQFARAVAIV